MAQAFSSPIKLVIFDMDGTMLDTETLSREGLIHAARQLGYDADPAFFEKMIGRNEAFARRLVAETYGPNFDFARAHHLHLQHMDAHFAAHGVPLLPGLLELLHYLENARIEKCVATSTARDRAIHKLTLANIAHRFATITGGDQVAESKPNPEIFHIAAASCNTAPENCLVIEDSTAGAQAAKAAGMKLVIIPNVAYLSDETKATADYICKDLNEVIGLLE